MSSDTPGKKFYNVDQPSGNVKTAAAPIGVGVKFAIPFSSSETGEIETLALPAANLFSKTPSGESETLALPAANLFSKTPSGESEAWTHNP